MHARTIIASTILALAAFGHAEPIPSVYQYDIGSAIDSWTSMGGFAYSHATAEAASYYSDGLSAASVGVQEGRSDASTWLAAHTTWGDTEVGAVFATATSIGGVAESIVTSVGGPAITLAASGGVVTSFASSEYTVIASSTSAANAAVNAHSMTLIASPVLTALVTVVGGSLLGAWLTC